MMKIWMTTLLLFFTTSFSTSQAQMMIDQNVQGSMKVFSEGEKGHLDAYYLQTGRLVVKGMEIKGFDQASMEKLQKAFDALETVVNTEEFKNRVINFKNSKGERAFASNKGMSNEKVYSVFMEGRETLQPNTPGEMNFYLKLYNKSWSRVVGYTSGNTNVININWKFFKGFAPQDVAGNLAHEWTHKLGFDHISAAEHDSAPYAIGYIVREMASQYLKGIELY